MTETPEQGWYQSPENAEMLRWWDGSQWTDKEKPKPSTEAAPPTGNPVEAEPKSKVSVEKVTDALGAAGLAAAGAALAADGAFGLGKKRKGLSGIGKFFIIGFSLILLSTIGFIMGVASAVVGTGRVETVGTVTNIQTDTSDSCIPTAEFTVNGTKVSTKGEEFVTCTWQIGDPIKVSFQMNTNGENAQIVSATSPLEMIGAAIATATIGFFVAMIGFVKLALRAGSIAGGFMLMREGLKRGKKVAK